MDNKLKALKVVDLKDILAKAHVPLQGKQNKADLINKILASPAALQLYQSQYAPPAPQQEPLPQPVSEPTPEVPPLADEAPPQPIPQLHSPPAPTDPPPSSDAETELERRKARAARFGIPLVESKVPKQKAPSQNKVTPAVPEDPGKRAARAARFGLKAQEQPQTAKSKKRAPSPDNEELERRKKRAERFGLNLAPATPS